MQLNIFERIILIDTLPKEGHYADLKAIRLAREVLTLNEEEVKATGYFEQEGKAFFEPQPALALIKDIPISEWVTNTIQSILVKKEKDGKLEDRSLTLYDKFVMANE